MPLWSLVLTSAGVAALVSSLATLLGHAAERRARRRELLLVKAIDMAQAKRAQVERRWERQGGRIQLQDDIVSAETYFRWLQAWLDSGSLPDDPQIQRISQD